MLLSPLYSQNPYSVIVDLSQHPLNDTHTIQLRFIRQLTEHLGLFSLFGIDVSKVLTFVLGH